MTPAEYRTLREGLGLTALAAARFHGLKSDRTIRYWESPDGAVPDGAADQIHQLDNHILFVVQQSLDHVKKQIKRHGGKPDMVALLRYMDDDDLARYQPDMADLGHAAHGALVRRMRRGLIDLGVPVTVVYMVRDAYERWLARENRVDSPDARSDWAVLQT